MSREAPQKPYQLPPIEEIDAGIRELVLRVNSHQLFCTWGSCEGHPEHEIFAAPNLGVAVCGLDGVQHLVAWLNAAQAKDEGLWIECSLNWSIEVYAGTDMGHVPGWVSFEIDLQRFDDEPPGARDLKTLFDALRIET